MEKIHNFRVGNFIKINSIKYKIIDISVIKRENVLETIMEIVTNLNYKMIITMKQILYLMEKILVII